MSQKKNVDVKSVTNITRYAILSINILLLNKLFFADINCTDDMVKLFGVLGRLELKAELYSNYVVSSLSKIAREPLCEITSFHKLLLLY